MYLRSDIVMFRAHIVKARREILVDVSLELKPGESVALFGASGAGKSTVLACIAGVETPDEGFVTFGDITFFPPSLPLHKRHVGYLTQEPGLFPHLRVDQNVGFGVSTEIAKQSEHATWIKTLRDRLHLDSVWSASAGSISGGQARRVALARMLARKPQLVLLDEPFAGLDRHLIRELIDDLVFWNHTLGFSMIVVDHRVEILKRLCPQHAIAVDGGRVVQRGSWAELDSLPATPSLRSLLAPL